MDSIISQLFEMAKMDSSELGTQHTWQHVWIECCGHHQLEEP
jgi:hypothetical protein